MEVRKVIKHPVDAKIKIHFGIKLDVQLFPIRNRFHLINTLILAIALGNEKGEFPEKVEIYDDKKRLIGYVECGEGVA